MDKLIFYETIKYARVALSYENDYEHRRFLRDACDMSVTYAE